MFWNGQEVFVSKEREREKERGWVRLRIHTSLNSPLYISYHLGAFFSIAVLFRNKNGALFPFGLQNAAAAWENFTVAKRKRRERKEKKNWKKTFFFSHPAVQKRHMNVFPLHFMWATHMYCCCLHVVVNIRMNLFVFFLNFSFSHSIRGIRDIYVFLWPAP